MTLPASSLSTYKSSFGRVSNSRCNIARSDGPSGGSMTAVTMAACSTRPPPAMQASAFAHSERLRRLPERQRPPERQQPPTSACDEWMVASLRFLFAKHITMTTQSMNQARVGRPFDFLSQASDVNLDHIAKFFPIEVIEVFEKLVL